MTMIARMPTRGCVYDYNLFALDFECVGVCEGMCDERNLVDVCSLKR